MNVKKLFPGNNQTKVSKWCILNVHKKKTCLCGNQTAKCRSAEASTTSKQF